MRYKSFLLSFISSSLIITAASAEAPRKLDYNLYGGVNLGYQHTKHHYKITQTTADVGNIPGVVTHFKKSPSTGNVLPEIYIGYRHYLHPFFLGVELTANLSMAKTKFNSTDEFTNEANHRIEDKYTLKPQLVIGGAVANNITLFVKAGPCFSHHKFATTLLSNNQTVRNSKTVTRFSGSIGIEFHHCNVYGTRLEVGFTPARTVKAKNVISDVGTSFDRKFSSQHIAATASIFFKV